MSARKLQQEMERVFKRVLEGTQAFDQIYDKLQNSANQSQKEKLEADLKKELKKLQKLRDQIKTWIGSNDVRDKKQLMEQRRLIENEMERFKVVEREIKQKTWQQSNDDDPHFEEKKEICDFLSEQIETLEQQTEQLEAEEEQLQQSKRGKKDSQRQDRIAEIEHLVERNKWHVEKMEVMIRMVENDTLAFEAVEEIKDDILYYVESNTEVDFAEDEALYDDLGLVEDDEEEAEQIVRDDTYTLEDLAQDLSKERQAEKEKKRSPEPLSTPASPAPATPAKPVPAYAAAAASGAASASTANLHSTPIHNSGASASTASLVSSYAPPQPQYAPAPLPQSLPPYRERDRERESPAPQPQATPARVPTPPLELPGPLADLAPYLKTLKARLASPNEHELAQKVEKSYTFCPDSVVSDRPRYYYADSPYPTPDYYPGEQLASLDNPEIFAKMDLDTLFYIFYYRQGSYQQYLAAKELKTRSWRFHKRFLTWFQRHEDPKTINTEFEQGTYRFFDFEGSWLQRRKSNFKFEYQYLEDEI